MIKTQINIQASKSIPYKINIIKNNSIIIINNVNININCSNNDIINDILNTSISDYTFFDDDFSPLLFEFSYKLPLNYSTTK